MTCRVYGDAPMQQRPPLIGSRRAGFLARARVCGVFPWVLGILPCGTPRTSLWKTRKPPSCSHSGNEHRFDLLTCGNANEIATVAQRTVSGESCRTTQARSSVVRGGTSQKSDALFYGTLGPASPAKRIDPNTGEVIEIISTPRLTAEKTS